MVNADPDPDFYLMLFGSEGANRVEKGSRMQRPKKKANRRTKEKDPEGGSRDQNIWGSIPGLLKRFTNTGSVVSREKF